MMNEPSRPKLSDDWQSQIEQACRRATLRLSFPSFMSIPLLQFFLTCVIVMVASAQVHAERKLIVNGELMEGDNLSILDAMSGAEIKNGYYWVNFNTWEWGEAAPSEGSMPHAGILVRY